MTDLPEGFSSSHRALEDVTREQFARVAWTHKTMEKHADRVLWWATFAKWLDVVLIALTTGSALSVLLGATKAATATAVLSALSLAVTLALLRFTPDEQMARAADAARRLWEIREGYVLLLADIRDGHADRERLRARGEALVRDTVAVYRSAPRTSRRAYEEATKALKEGEELTFTETEVDRLLPPALRRRHA
jgi:hypothetical protein